VRLLVGGGDCQKSFLQREIVATPPVIEAKAIHMDVSRENIGKEKIANIDYFAFRIYNSSMSKISPTNKLAYFWLAFYYFSFVVWIQFPAGHSPLDDLYQGRVTSYVILEGIHNHPSDAPFALFDSHSITRVHIAKCPICTTCTSNYSVTQSNSNLLIDSSGKDFRRNLPLFVLKPVAAVHHTRAPPTRLL